MSSISSDDSLGDLPLPYDISTAVSRALRINSTDGTAAPHERDGCPKIACPSNSLMGDDNSNVGIKQHVTNVAFNRAANHHSSSASYVYENTHFTSSVGFHHYPSNPPGPAVYDQFVTEPMDAWNDSTVTVSICSSSESMLDSQNDMEQLDQFCNYIVSNSDDELPLESTSTAASIYPAGAYPGPSYYYQYQPASVESPPRKKPRSTTNYTDYRYQSCSSPDSSLDKCISQQPGGNVHWAMKLDNGSLWRQFDEIGTEMVITKGGR